MKKKVIQGKVWTGFTGECGDRCPCYLLRPKVEAVFMCNILKKFVRKRVQITIKELP